MSGAADLPPPELPGWERLERAAGRAAAGVERWRRRALEAEAEVARLRAVLDGVARGEGDAAGAGEEIGRLRAENAVLLSRMAEARTRVSTLLSRLAVLEARR